MSERVQQLLSGNEAIAIDFGLGVIVLSLGAALLWHAFGEGRTDGRWLWGAVIGASSVIALAVPDMFFVVGMVARAMFFGVAVPAGGWLSAAAVVAAGGWAYGRHSKRKQESEAASTAPVKPAGALLEHIEHIKPELIETRPVALITSTRLNPEPARLVRVSTALAPHERRGNPLATVRQRRDIKEV